MESVMRQPLLHFIRENGDIDYSTFKDDLKNITREIGVRNMYIQNRLYDLMDSFEREGIQAIVLKGSHLIHAIYPFGVRPIEDIDLIIEREDWLMADRLIRELGYEDTARGMDLWTHMAFSNKLTYINQTHPVIPIDIHFSLGPYPYLGRLSHALLRENTETIETPRGRLTVLKPEVLLIHLCLHLFQHHFENWQVSCCDIVTVIRKYGDRLDWNKFHRLVRSNRLSLPVDYSLQKARELAGIEIPASAEAGIGRISLFDKYVFKSSQKQKSGFDRYFLQFITTPGLYLKLRGAIKIIAPGTSYLKHYHNGKYSSYVAHITKTAVNRVTAVFKRR